MSFREACELLSTHGNGIEHNDEVKRLIKENVMHNETDESKNTLLHHAAKGGNYEIVQYLVDSGSNVNSKNDLGKTPLITALENDSLNKQVIKCLLEAGADIFLEDNLGKSAVKVVDSSAWLGENIERYDIYKVFLERANDLNDFEVLQIGNESVIKMLLETNIDLSATDSDGNTLIHMLAQNGNPGIMQLLDNKNFDINVRDGDGWTPLMIAALHETINAIEFLLNKGADTEVVDEDLQTALFIACEENSSEDAKKCIQLLLEHGANAQLESVSEGNAFTIFDLVLECENFTAGDLILAHLALKEASGTTLTELIRSKIDSNIQFKKYFDFCKEQLAIKIYRSVTLLDVLTASDRKLEHFLYDKELASKLIALQAPDYFDTILRKRYLKANLMIGLRQTAAPIICELIKISYDSYPFIADEIASYLEEKDMECLISIQNELFC